MRAIHRVGLRIGVALALTVSAGRAERELSSYEESVLAEVEARAGAARDPAPDGKWVESIEVHRVEVFDRRDPIPDFLNWLHATTRERLVAREVLLGVGRPFSAALAAESERNLRAIYQLSLVLVVPLRGAAPDRVRLAVVTKDVWSLRAAWDPEITREGFLSSHLAVDEINLAGHLKTASLRGGFDPGSFWYGLRYVDPRVAGSRQFALAGAQLVFDRDTGAPEGSFGNLWYGQDLFSLETRWAYDAFIGWRRDVEEIYLGGSPRTFDADVTAADDALPLEWERGVYFAGCVRMTERFLASDPPAGAEMEALRRHASETLAAGMPTSIPRPTTRLVGAGGTITSAAALSLALGTYAPERIHGFLLTIREIRRLADLLVSLPLARRREIPGIEEKRADILPAGLMVLEAIMAFLSAAAITVSDEGILHGALLAWGGGTRRTASSRGRG